MNLRRAYVGTLVASLVVGLGGGLGLGCSDSGHVVGMVGAAGAGGAAGTTGSGGAGGSSGAAGVGGSLGRAGGGGTAGGTAGTGGAAGGGGATGGGGGAAGGGGGGAAGSGGGRAGSGGAGRGGGGGTTGGAGSGGGTGGASGGAGAGGSSGTCTVSCPALFPNCCGNNVCVWTGNDPEHCGGCGIRCPEARPYCNGSTCLAQPCTPTPADGGACGAGPTCCGTTCCGAGQNCCSHNSPIGPPRAACHTPTTEAPRCPGDAMLDSDRNIKRDVVAADVDEVLARLRGLQIATWTYKREPTGVRHLGPMAQDFHAAFGLGDDDRTYHPVDGHGVALAAIQALDRLVRDQQQRLDTLERDNRQLRRRLDERAPKEGRPHK